MASLREIKLRIRSIKSTQKITKAMEMVAASKMKKAQAQAVKGRPYVAKLTEIIDNLIQLSDPPLTHPFLQAREKVDKDGYILFTANRGLCGAFNSSVIRTMLEILKEKRTPEIILTVGKKGRQTMERIGKSILADFSDLSGQPSFLDTLGISKVIFDEYLNGNIDEVWLVYNHFYSTFIQKPVVKKLLPIETSKDTIKLTVKTDYIFEGSRAKLLDELLHRFINMQVYQTVLESLASEHSARMMAMRKASDNAKEIIQNLTLAYNKGRQSKITSQILEIVGGAR